MLGRERVGAQPDGSSKSKGSGVFVTWVRPVPSALASHRSSCPMPFVKCVRENSSFVLSGDHTGSKEMSLFVGSVTRVSPLPSGCTTYTWVEPLLNT